MQTIILSILIILVIYIVFQGIQLSYALKTAERRLAGYDASTAQLSYGQMTYVDKGKGEVILAVHGIFGGYDQGFDAAVKEHAINYRILAPSRFGYLGSATKGNNSPAEQAKAFVELLDFLKIDKVYILGTSAGGTVAIRFALDYPERTNGLILYCSAPPFAEKPSTYRKYQGPPPFLCNNLGMYLLSPFFKPIMGMERSTIYTMLPINQRCKGVHIDATITNPDMAKNFENYPIETLKVPVLIFHAKDDKIVPYNDMARVVHRFPNSTFVSFEKGGHLMKGHSEEINRKLTEFICPFPFPDPVT